MNMQSETAWEKRWFMLHDCGWKLLHSVRDVETTGEMYHVISAHKGKTHIITCAADIASAMVLIYSLTAESPESTLPQLSEINN